MATTEPRAHNEYTIGWVCALPKEQTAATAMLDERHPDLPKPSTDQNAYILGAIGSHNIVIACLPKGKIGTVSAATVATQMISTYPSIRFGLMVGIGSGVPPKVRLGDVVVSTPIGHSPGTVRWDFGKTKEKGFGRCGALNNPPTLLLTALTKLETEHELNGSKVLEYVEEIGRKYPRLVSKYLKSDSLKDVLFRADYSHVGGGDSVADKNEMEEEEKQESCQFCDQTMVIRRKPREMKIHYGLIASGNQVIKDTTFRDELDKDLGGSVLCIENEAAGLMNTFPCLVVRGICDYADSHKNEDWQEHAAAVAAAFAKDLIGYVQPGDVEKESLAKDAINKILGTLSKVQGNIEAINYLLDDEKNHKILNWFTPVDYGLQQSDYLAKRQPGTGDWFLNSEEFQTWLNDDTSSPTREGTQPPLGEVSKVLLDIITTYSKVFITIDALDECAASEDCRSRFLKEIFKLQKNSGVRILATSRPILSIMDQFALQGCLNLPIRATDDDIRKYLDDRLPRIEGVVQRDSELQEEVKRMIIKSVDGMFLLARLQVDSLVDLGLPHEVRAILEGNQTGSSPYHKIYGQTIKKIKARGGIPGQRAMKVLSWITCAQRPLSPSELQHALAVDIGVIAGRSELNTEYLLEPKYMVALCGGLVTIDEASNVIRLIHFTTQEYLANLLLNAHAEIARTCISYLSYGNFNYEDTGLDSMKLKRKFELNALYEYAARYWGFHARSIDGDESVLKFLRNRSQVTTFTYSFSPYPQYFPSLSNRGGKMHIAAYWGLEKSLLVLIKEGRAKQNVLLRSWALYLPIFGHGDLEFDARDSIGRTPLHWAARHGKEAVVRVLLNEGAKVDAKDRTGITPFHLTVYGPHSEIAKILLAKGANINGCFEYWTPLTTALKLGHYEMVKFLLANGADANANPPEFKSPLAIAAGIGNYEMIKLLLAYGADINAGPPSHGTPLRDGKIIM
ncbi:hypothetical protein ABW20_dc0109543 [Dactylellina cionopaga]|nr:hypothetical protein ABW20_dc0109543 [Dactylellina cionopaga]